MRPATIALAVLAAASAALPAPAHWATPEDLIRRLESAESRAAFDIREVRRDPALPRLLVIRVGPRWSEISAERRTEWAEEWNHLWRSTIASGIVAVLDSATEQPLVNFDADGRASLKRVQPTATARPSVPGPVSRQVLFAAVVSSREGGADLKVIDLRSDTVTRPTTAMRAAMASAEVGDDVYGEDPTVDRLQRMAAERLGKEAALFVPSGTMANQTAVRALTSHGDVVLAGEGSHVLRYESGGAAAISGVQIQTIGRRGLFDAADVRAALVPSDHHYAPIRLVAVENTHNTGGGRVFPYERIVEIARAARESGLLLHLDGARLFNAVVASGIAARDWAQHFDTVSFCLSKGLGAPVGSLVCGSYAVIDRVHRFRKMFGGGMRQAGIVAAAGIYALEHHVERLAEDHENARRLAAGLTEIGIEVAPPPETNIVMFRVREPGPFLTQVHQRALLLNPPNGDTFRAVLHLDIGGEDIDEALRRIGAAARG